LQRIDRFPGRYLAGLAEVVLVASVGLQCVTLLGVGISPLGPAQLEPERPMQRPPSAILSSYDAFFRQPGGGAVAVLAATGLELHGVRQDGRAGRGSAIISESEGPQRNFGVGEAISPGLVLKDVGPGYATIARNGVEERLAFAEFEAPIAGGRPPGRIGPSTRSTAAPLAAPSIDFADPSTLPASLTAPAAATASIGKSGE
jgi:hypothetical protein